MKGFNWRGQASADLFVVSLRCLVAAFFLIYSASVFSQTAPGLTIAPSGTNQFSITITNAIGTSDYDLQWTPVLGSTNFPWTFAAIGVPGETNFILNRDGYPATFFRAVLDNNTVPLWKAANPGNTNSPILQVFIYGPANGAVLH